jgi:ubiquinone/menaquinone biosynthesis C-methylase UbiE
MEKTPEQFYKELGTKGLVARKEEIHTKKELVYLKKLLSKKQRILDLACGYGRFTIPLVKQGYNVEGIDISPNLLKEARKRAKEENLKIKFKFGDMRKLPYKEKSFDTIICMWSAFIELHKKQDQIKALKEMLRILDEDGFAILEMPKPKRTKKRVVVHKIDEITATPMYVQNRDTLKDLMKNVNVKKYKIFVDDFGGRDRLFLMFWK